MVSFILREVGNAGLLVIGNRVNCFYLYYSFVPTVCICCFPDTVALFREYIIPNTTISISPKNFMGVLEVSSYSPSS